MSIEQESRIFWNEEAPKWVSQKNLWGELDGPIHSYISNSIDETLSDIPKKSLILDLGTGANTKKYFDNKIISRVIGLDISEKMLQLNRIDNKINAALNKTLPIKNNSIGLITSFFTMRYQSREDHLNMLCEYSRVLMPGGQLLIIDFCLNPYNNQLSTFDNKKLGEMAKLYGYDEVKTENEHLSAGFYHDGWGGSCGGKSTTLYKLVATKPVGYQPTILPDDKKLAYLRADENGNDYIQIRDRRIGAF